MKKNNNTILTFIISILLFLPKALDPDFWWHLRLGKEISEHGNWLNNLTYTCEDYLWNNHSWLSDVLFYKIYEFGGYLLLGILISAIVSIGVYFQSKIAKLYISDHKLIYPLLILINFPYMLMFGTIRPQLIGYTIFTVFLYFVLKVYKSNKTSRRELYSILMLMLLWANLHGSFVLGIALILVFSIIRIYKNNEKILIISLFNLALILTTLINPFGFNLWTELASNVLGNQGSLIKEWQAISFDSIIELLILGIITLLIILVTHTKKRHIEINILTLVFTLGALISIRYLLFASVLLSIALLIYLSEFLKSKIIKNLNNKDLREILRYWEIIILLILSFITIYSVTLFTKSYKQFEGEQISSYPFEAIEYLQQNTHLKSLKFYNDYHLGGFLSFKVPDVQWFVDGRMPVWTCRGEISGKFITDVFNINFTKGDWISIINEYRIDAILTAANSDLADSLKYIYEWEKIFENKNSIIFIRKD